MSTAVAAAIRKCRQAADLERWEWGGDTNARIYPRPVRIHLAVAVLLESIADSMAATPDFGIDVEAVELAEAIIDAAEMTP